MKGGGVKIKPAVLPSPPPQKIFFFFPLPSCARCVPSLLICSLLLPCLALLPLTTYLLLFCALLVPLDSCCAK